MSENKRLNNYDELPLVLDVADIQRIIPHQGRQSHFFRPDIFLHRQADL